MSADLAARSRSSVSRAFSVLVRPNFTRFSAAVASFRARALALRALLRERMSAMALLSPAALPGQERDKRVDQGPGLVRERIVEGVAERQHGNEANARTVRGDREAARVLAGAETGVRRDPRF